MTRDDDGDDDLAALWETTREASEADADDHPSVSGRRATCESCGRPARACLCPNLPETPFPTRGALVILTHPNEHKRALATGWILPRCLRRCAVLTRRSPPDAFLRMLGPADADDDTDGGVLPADAPIYLLYPAPHATDVTRVDVRADAESLRSACEGDVEYGGGGGGGGGRSRAASLRNSPPLAKRSGTPHTCASPSTPRGDRRGRWWCARWRRYPRARGSCNSRREGPRRRRGCVGCGNDPAGTSPGTKMVMHVGTRERFGWSPRRGAC